MTVEMPAEVDSRQLLARALQDPFGDASASVREWLLFLMRQYPLWAFQRHRFASLQVLKNLPATHPLPLIIESILGDDGIEGRPAPVSAELDRRRYALLSGELPARWDTEDVRRYPQFLPFVFSLVYVPQDGRESRNRGSLYEELGRELVQLIEARDRALPKTVGRVKAEEGLQNLLRRIGALRPRGKPPEIVVNPLLKELMKEGRALLGLCWTTLPVEMSDRVVEALERLRVPRSEMPLWIRRLCLPVLSRPEILAMEDQARIAAEWKKGKGFKPTPRTLATWMLARRLGLPATAVARRLFDSESPKYFRFKANPIDPFCYRSQAPPPAKSRN